MLVKLGEGDVFIFNNKYIFAEILNTYINNLVVEKIESKKKTYFAHYTENIES